MAKALAHSGNEVLSNGENTVRLQRMPFRLHQTVILCVGWFVIRWNIGLVPKYLIIAVASFALIMALYELLVRHFNVVRFFFGMRPKKRTARMATSIPEGTAG